jgi:ornithine cyclodeaminase/alanine dehydrogenase
MLVSRQAIVDAISLPEIIGIVEEVFAGHGRGEVVMPTKITLDLSASGEPNWMNAMPAYVPASGSAGIKWAGGFLHNGPRRSLDYVQAMALLNDPLTGAALAVMDAVWVTNARTGAVPAVVYKYLKPDRPARVALVGTGMQARWTLRSLAATSELTHVAAYDIRPEAAAAFAKEMEAELGVAVTVAASVKEAVTGASLVVTATTANEPLVLRDWVAPGTVVVSLGSYQELDDALVLNADLLLVDHLDQNIHRGEFKRLFESGNLSESDVHAEFGAIVAGVASGRSSEDQIIVASMIGLASLDIAILGAVYQRLLKGGDSPTFAFDRV